MKASELIKTLQEIGSALEAQAAERASALLDDTLSAIKEHEDELTRQNEELDNLRSDFEYAQHDAVSEDAFNRLEERVEELEGQDIDQMARRIDDLEEKVENQESEIERLGEELEGAERRIEDLEEKVSAMLRALTRAGSALNNLTDGE